MTEITNEQKLTRRQFLIRGAKQTTLILAEPVKNMLTTTGKIWSALLVGTLPTWEMLSKLKKDKIPEAESKLAQIFNLPVNIVLKDHIAPNPGNHTLFRTGELSPPDLLITSEDFNKTLASAPEDSIWIGGAEIKMGADRLNKRFNTIRNPKLLAALDGDSGLHQYSYLTEVKNRKRLLFFLPFIFVRSPAVAYSLYNLWKNLKLNRRDFLKITGLAATGTLVEEPLVKFLINQYENPDLSNFTPVEQELFEIFSYNDATNLRNQIMINNLNSLTGIEYREFVESLELFAGDGHVGIINELSKTPQQLEEEVRTGVNSVLKKFILLNNKYASDPEAQKEIETFAYYVYSSIFGPVVLRVNYTDQEVKTKGMTDLASIQQNFTNEPSSPSTFVIFVEEAKKLIQDLNQNSSSANKDTAPDSINFITNLIALLCIQYGKPNHNMNQQDNFEIGFPIGSHDAVQLVDVLGLKIFVNKGHLAKVEGL